MLLYIARHAWAGHFGDPGWPDDSLRELTPEGVERYTRVVQTLAERGFAPERLATSPYARCRQTADLIAAHTPHQPEVEELPALEPGADLKTLLAWTRREPDAETCWVGHNPDVEWMVAELAGVSVRFKKGSVAALRLESGGAELLWHTTAKQLGV